MPDFCKTGQNEKKTSWLIILIFEIHFKQKEGEKYEKAGKSIPGYIGSDRCGIFGSVSCREHSGTRSV